MYDIGEGCFHHILLLVTCNVCYHTFSFVEGTEVPVKVAASNSVSGKSHIEAYRLNLNLLL